MIRAVLEGICYHLRWMLECQERKAKTSDAVRFCGGGALSDVTSQILADITGRTVQVVDSLRTWELWERPPWRRQDWGK